MKSERRIIGLTGIWLCAALVYFALTDRCSIDYCRSFILKEQFVDVQNIDTGKDIHLVLTLRGHKAILRSVPMLKSMFYYQGRLNTSRDECKNYLDRNSRCPNSMVKPLRKTVLHILTDKTSKPLIDQAWSAWKLQNLEVQHYFVEKQIRMLSRIPNHHVAGVEPMLKLILTDILPKSVTKVAVIDSDTLFNADISRFWDQFDEFGDEQSLGFAYEQAAPYCDVSMNTVIPYKGINGGVALLRLDRLVSQTFKRRWKYAMNKKLERVASLPLGEQGLITDVIKKWPDMYFRIPCLWNMQMYYNSTGCCPVIWPVLNPTEQNCYNKTEQMVRLVHNNRSPKPDGAQPGIANWTLPRNYGGLLNVTQLRTRFFEVFAFFSSIPDECFH